MALQQAAWDQNRSEYDPPKVTVSLRDLRNTLRIPTDEFASRLGISAPYLRRIEAGKRGVSNEMAEKIAVTLSEYFAGNR